MLLDGLHVDCFKIEWRTGKSFSDCGGPGGRRGGQYWRLRLLLRELEREPARSLVLAAATRGMFSSKQKSPKARAYNIARSGRPKNMHDNEHTP